MQSCSSQREIIPVDKKLKPIPNSLPPKKRFSFETFPHVHPLCVQRRDPAIVLDEIIDTMRFRGKYQDTEK